MWSSPQGSQLPCQQSLNITTLYYSRNMISSVSRVSRCIVVSNCIMLTFVLSSLWGWGYAYPAGDGPALESCSADKVLLKKPNTKRIQGNKWIWLRRHYLITELLNYKMRPWVKFIDFGFLSRYLYDGLHSRLLLSVVSIHFCSYIMFPTVLETWSTSFFR